MKFNLNIFINLQLPYLTCKKLFWFIIRLFSAQKNGYVKVVP